MLQVLRLVSGNRNAYRYGHSFLRPDETDADIASRMPLKNVNGVVIGREYIDTEVCL